MADPHREGGETERPGRPPDGEAIPDAAPGVRLEQFRELVESSPDYITLHDLDGRLLFANPSVQRLLGRPAEALVGKGQLELPPLTTNFSPEVAAMFEARLLEVARTGRATAAEPVWQQEDGRPPTHHDVRFIPVFDAGGRVKAIAAFGRDISAMRAAERERAQAHELLHQRDQEFRALVEHAPDPVLRYDRSGRRIYVNPAFEKVAGAPAASLLDRAPRESPVGSAEAGAEAQQAIDAVLRDGVARVVEMSWQDGSGARRSFQVTYVPELDRSGAVATVLGVARDISALKRSEEELRRAQKMEAFGQLAGGVAHDFNNLLTVIQGNAALLQGGATGADGQACLEQIVEAADRAARLTRQLLLFSRRQAAQLRSLDLNEVVSDMARMLRRLIGEHIQLEARFAPGGAAVHADLSMMEQVVMNLAVNARDAMPQGGRLILDTALVEGGAQVRPGRWVRLSVTDTGHGIAAEHLPHLFEPFFTTKEVGKGTGLGLATVYGIVEQHRGWIEVQSRPGEGTTFQIFLPRLAQASAAAGPAAPEGLRGGTETVLLVEDDASVRRLTRTLLQRHGYQVLEASTGAKALEVWARHGEEVALLLTDVVLPGGMNGWELAERLRAERPGLEVIYSTGYTDDMLGEASALRGTPQVLEKPYDLRELARRVRTCLDGRGTRG